MKAYVKRHIITQTSLDSGALTMLGSVVHRFPDPGDYEISVLRKDTIVGSIELTVDEECPVMQVDIDLATVHQATPDPCGREPEKRYMVGPKGYAVFFVSRGAGGYAVVASGPGGKAGSNAFDSRELEKGDVFAATLVRPGIYSVTNILTGAKGEITVGYPSVGEVPYHPPEPVSIECSEDALEPDKLKIVTGQGQVYRVEASSRIKIELVKPDDGPEGAEKAKIFAWRKPLGYRASVGPDRSQKQTRGRRQMKRRP